MQYTDDEIYKNKKCLRNTNLLRRQLREIIGKINSRCNAYHCLQDKRRGKNIIDTVSVQKYALSKIPVNIVI
jgi:hypothetical protein